MKERFGFTACAAVIVDRRANAEKQPNNVLPKARRFISSIRTSTPYLRPQRAHIDDGPASRFLARSKRHSTDRNARDFSRSRRHKRSDFQKHLPRIAARPRWS